MNFEELAKAIVVGFRAEYPDHATLSEYSRRPLIVEVCLDALMGAGYESCDSIYVPGDYSVGDVRALAEMVRDLL